MMIMNVRMSRTLALLAALSVATPAACAADLGPQLTAANAAPATDKAAEAQRLAAMAAQLAQQAAQLAAESNGATAAKPAPPAKAGWSAGKSINQSGTRLPQPIASD